MIACTRSRLSRSAASARLRAVTSCTWTIRYRGRSCASRTSDTDTSDDQLLAVGAHAGAARPRSRAPRRPASTARSARPCRSPRPRDDDVRHVACRPAPPAGVPISSHSARLTRRKHPARSLLDADQRHADRRVLERAAEALLGLLHDRPVALAGGRVTSRSTAVVNRLLALRSSARTRLRAGSRSPSRTRGPSSRRPARLAVLELRTPACPAAAPAGHRPRLRPGGRRSARRPRSHTRRCPARPPTRSRPRPSRPPRGSAPRSGAAPPRPACAGSGCPPARPPRTRARPGARPPRAPRARRTRSPPRPLPPP